MKKRFLTLLLACVVFLAVTAGCTSGGTAESGEVLEPQTTSETQAQDTPEDSIQPGEQESEDTSVPIEPADDVTTSSDEWTYTPLSYPLTDEPVTFTYWMIMDLSPNQTLTDWNDHPVLEISEEKTGISITLLAQSQATGTEKTNLMLASNDYPDMIGGFNYTQGISKAIEDEIILELRSYLPDEAPDYWKYLYEDESLLKDIATDDGEIGVFAAISNGSRGPTDGLIIRQDWLDALDLETPETYDEFADVLRAFKTEYNTDETLYMTMDGVLEQDLIAAGFDLKLKFNTMTGLGGFYIQDGKVKFGYSEPAFADYLNLMKGWYEEGLISSEFTSAITTYKNEQMISSILSGGTGLFTRGDGLIDMLTANSADPNAELVAVADMVQNKGDQLHIGNAVSMASGSTGLVITTGCENPELAMNWINYWYTDEGYMYTQYGYEDTTYEYDANGAPQYTEFMTNNPNAILSVMKLDWCGMFAARTNNLIPEASYSKNAQDAPVIWGSNKDGEYEIPAAATMTTEEGENFNNIFSDISTYCAENTVKFIIGEKPMSELEGFQEQISAMGVDECIAIYEAAIERYNNR